MAKQEFGDLRRFLTSLSTILKKINAWEAKAFHTLTRSVQEYSSVVLIFLAIILLILIVRHETLGLRWANWTGLGEYTGPLTEEQRGKTLWDWLDLLIVPLVLAGGAFWLNKTEKKNEQEIATDRQREQALQSYFDKMTDLLLDKDNPLRASAKESEVRVVASARTLATLRTLDPVRKRMLLEFLYGAGLIKEESNYVLLAGADLREADLHSVVLMDAFLVGVDLSGADLRNAELGSALLVQANLNKVDLTSANLMGATLITANLVEANLSGTNLDWADLSGANLRGAILGEARQPGYEWIFTKLSKHTTMPDGRKYDPDIHGLSGLHDPEEDGMRKIPEAESTPAD